MGESKPGGGGETGGNLWDWIMIDTYFYTGGSRIVNSQQ